MTGSLQPEEVAVPVAITGVAIQVMEMEAVGPLAPTMRAEAVEVVILSAVLTEDLTAEQVPLHSMAEAVEAAALTAAGRERCPMVMEIMQPAAEP